MEKTSQEVQECIADTCELMYYKLSKEDKLNEELFKEVVIPYLNKIYNYGYNSGYDKMTMDLEVLKKMPNFRI